MCPLLWRGKNTALSKPWIGSNEKLFKTTPPPLIRERCLTHKPQFHFRFAIAFLRVQPASAVEDVRVPVCCLGLVIFVGFGALFARFRAFFVISRLLIALLGDDDLVEEPSSAMSDPIVTHNQVVKVGEVNRFHCESVNL